MKNNKSSNYPMDNSYIGNIQFEKRKKKRKMG
jgi:hypothetical protein